MRVNKKVLLKRTLTLGMGATLGISTMGGTVYAADLDSYSTTLANVYIEEKEEKVQDSTDKDTTVIYLVENSKAMSTSISGKTRIDEVREGCKVLTDNILCDYPNTEFTVITYAKETVISKEYTSSVEVADAIVESEDSAVNIGAGIKAVRDYITQDEKENDRNYRVVVIGTSNPTLSYKVTDAVIVKAGLLYLPKVTQVDYNNVVGNGKCVHLDSIFTNDESECIEKTEFYERYTVTGQIEGLFGKKYEISRDITTHFDATFYEANLLSQMEDVEAFSFSLGLVSEGITLGMCATSEDNINCESIYSIREKLSNYDLNITKAEKEEEVEKPTEEVTEEPTKGEEVEKPTEGITEEPTKGEEVEKPTEEVTEETTKGEEVETTTEGVTEETTIEATTEANKNNGEVLATEESKDNNTKNEGVLSDQIMNVQTGDNNSIMMLSISAVISAFAMAICKISKRK